ncbi:hypothetical protein PPERSA_02239 [Pseudocohnilembus persalinus]|uniref:Transmembrane protein n=1 Tax=Pseudocohnilembus persalinus TaxID=266149 RepID=A0A0V0QKF7_PSEPJ|nr:hypothetical protein PPERSA_02239 [Pseudocohnilembus persalinus]|eukprot:KRX02749.1 hypothetical protein PPERSA_02239 [Pseudocohnilembus persalinus]
MSEKHDKIANDEGTQHPIYPRIQDKNKSSSEIKLFSSNAMSKLSCTCYIMSQSISDDQILISVKFSFILLLNEFNYGVVKLICLFFCVIFIKSSFIISERSSIVNLNEKQQEKFVPILLISDFKVLVILLRQSKIEIL